MDHFIPISASIGGMLIGPSAGMLWLGIGPISGIGGILGNLLALRTSDIAWRVAFLAGLVAAPILYRMTGGVLPDIVLSAHGRLRCSAVFWSASAPYRSASGIRGLFASSPPCSPE